MAEFNEDKIKTEEETTEAQDTQATVETEAEQAEAAEAAVEASEETETEEGSEEPQEDTEAGDGKEPDKKFKFFNKKKDKKDIQIEELTDRVIRQAAEFDNYRKRTDREKSQMYEMGAGDMAEKILPVIDNFERGLDAMTEADKETSFAKGMELIYKQLTTVLENNGVKAIEAVGQPFDPMFHNAVMQTASEEHESGTVTQELQKGYMYKEKVIRHSMVMVAE